MNTPNDAGGKAAGGLFDQPHDDAAEVREEAAVEVTPAEHTAAPAEQHEEVPTPLPEAAHEDAAHAPAPEPQDDAAPEEEPHPAAEPAQVEEAAASDTAAAATPAATPQEQQQTAATKTAIMRDEDEPYEFSTCTVSIDIQLLPDDGHEDGREVIVSVSSHIEGPIIEITRLRMLEPFSPLILGLLKQHEERLPGLGVDRARQRELASSKASSARSKTTVRPGAARTSSASRPAPSSSGNSGGTTSGTQTSLFNLSTGQRPTAPAGTSS